MNSHTPVMLNQVIKGLNIVKNGNYIDATFGFGGHSKKILESLDRSMDISIIRKIILIFMRIDLM